MKIEKAQRDIFIVDGNEFLTEEEARQYIREENIRMNLEIFRDKNDILLGRMDDDEVIRFIIAWQDGVV